MRAIVGHLARAGVIQPAPSAPDRVVGPRRRRRGTAGRSRVCRASAQRGHARALAPVPRRCGPASRATSCRRRGHPAPLRRPRRRRAPRARAATSATRRSSRRAGAAGARRGGPPARAAPRRRPSSTTRSSTSCAAPSRRVGRTRAVEILRGGALEGDRQVLLRRAAGLRHLRRTCAPTRSSRASTSCSQAGTPALAPAGAFPKLEQRAREGRRPRLRARAPTSRRSSTASTAATASRSSRVGLRQARRAGARARAGGRASTTRASSRRRRTPTARARDAAMADWLVRARASSSSCSPATCSCSTRGVPRPLPAARHQRPPGAAARLPGHRRDRAGARLRRQGLRRHRPLRRRGRRHRPDHPPAGDRAPGGAPTPTRSARALRPIEHELLPRGGPADRRAAPSASTPPTRGACSWRR